MTQTFQEERIIGDILERRISHRTLDAAIAIVTAGRPHQSIVIDMLAGAKKLTNALKEEVTNALLIEITNGQVELDARRLADYRRFVGSNRGECVDQGAR